MNNNLKKVISSVAAFAVVASTATALAAFPDVDQSASYAGAVDTLTALGIVEGDDNGKFNPDNSVTRAEFAKMVVEARGEGAAAESQTYSQFTDSQGHWAVGYIAQGVSDGFINGYDDTTFGPDDTVTYAQAVKMLVCAIGYDAFAVRAGGWPTGYLSYGNSLEITNGVSGVTNDTALTRSQCAVLINNTLKAPLVVFDGIEYGGLTGTVPMDKVTVKDGVGKDWQTLLTNNHDAYAVKGRVTQTSKTASGLDAGQVKYKVEVAENFDGNEVSKTIGTTEVEAYVGSTNAENMLFAYSDAIIQKDEDTDEWTLISVTPYGANKSESFAAADVSEDDSNVATEGSKKLAVYKSATSTSVTNYKLSDTVKLYVNGVEYNGGVSDSSLTDFIYNNTVGTVTLIDETTTGSTSTDGYYDYILVDYYKDAVADYVSEASSGITTIYFNAFEAPLKTKLAWDTEDEDISVKFIKDGAEINPADVQQDDVLSISYDVNGDFDESSFYEILVSQNTVTGTASSKYEDDGDYIVVVDGNEYIGTIDKFSDTSITLGTEYTFYLNAFGYVAKYDEGDSSKNYGVIVGMYDSNSEDYPVVRMITADGSVSTFVCRNDEEADNFAKAMQGAKEDKAQTWDALKTANGGKDSFTRTDLFGTSGISTGIQDNVVTYKTTSSGVRLDSVLAYNDVTGGEYKASSSKLGSYALSDATTTVLDVQSYLVGTDSAPAVMSVSSFIEETPYDAYVYDKSSNDGTYRFVIVTSGTSSVNRNTAVAVVQKAPMLVTVDDEEYQKVIVSREGNTDVEVLFEDGAAVKTVGDKQVSLEEGDVIVYVPGSDGIVTSVDTIMSINSNYASFRDAAIANDVFADGLNMEIPATWNDEDVETYFGAVYKKSNNNLEVLVKATDGVSNINTDDLVDITIDSDTKITMYDYSAKSGSGLRVYGSTALASSSSALYTPIISGSEDEYINWADAAKENVTPNFVFAKVVDGDVTDLVYILAE